MPPGDFLSHLAGEGSGVRCGRVSCGPRGWGGGRGGGEHGGVGGRTTGRCAGRWSVPGGGRGDERHGGDGYLRERLPDAESVPGTGRREGSLFPPLPRSGAPPRPPRRVGGGRFAGGLPAAELLRHSRPRRAGERVVVLPVQGATGTLRRRRSALAVAAPSPGAAGAPRGDGTGDFALFPLALTVARFPCRVGSIGCVPARLAPPPAVPGVPGRGNAGGFALAGLVLMAPRTP